jgi:hypothetical protein
MVGAITLSMKFYEDGLASFVAVIAISKLPKSSFACSEIVRKATGKLLLYLGSEVSDEIMHHPLKIPKEGTTTKFLVNVNKENHKNVGELMRNFEEREPHINLDVQILTINSKESYIVPIHEKANFVKVDRHPPSPFFLICWRRYGKRLLM